MFYWKNKWIKFITDMKMNALNTLTLTLFPLLSLHSTEHGHNRGGAVTLQTDTGHSQRIGASGAVDPAPSQAGKVDQNYNEDAFYAENTTIL